MTAVDPRDEAHAAQDRKVRYIGPADAPPQFRANLLAAVRARVGWPALEISQDEAVTVDGVADEPRGYRVCFTYVYDRDFCSQYPKVTTVSGEAIVATDGTVLATRWDDAPAPPG